MKAGKPFHKVLLAIGTVALLEVSARFGIPGVSRESIGDYWSRAGGNGLLSLYDRIGGGGVSRAGFVALGVMPYLSARIMVRLVRLVSPSMEAMAGHADGARQLTRWTRVLTVGLSLIQSFGFARWMESIPGAVAHPGPMFVAQTMAVLTTGTVIVMMLSEAIARPDDDEPADLDPPARVIGRGDALPIDVRVPTREPVKTR